MLAEIVIVRTSEQSSSFAVVVESEYGDYSLSLHVLRIFSKSSGFGMPISLCVYLPSAAFMHAWLGSIHLLLA